MNSQKKEISAFFVYIFLYVGMIAQPSVTLSGYIQDDISHEPLRQAQIISLQTGEGILSNEYGFFSLKLPVGKQKIVYRYSFYQADTLALYLAADTQIVLSLQAYVDLESIEITDQVPLEKQLEMSTHDLPIQQIKRLPAILGEVDVLKAVQLMPGVSGGSEATAGLHVRGGSADQNLILLDGVPLYYINHLGGFFSVFHPSSISQVKLIKGGFPARYGGRTSSVLDIRMKEGNMSELKGEASLGIISASAMLEGPIKRNKSSFLVSARRTYLDLFTRAISRSNSGGTRSTAYSFYDITAKANWIFSDKSKLYLSTYLGDDKIGIKFSEDQERVDEQRISENQNRLKWGNQLVMLRWNRIWGKNLFTNTIATYTRYRYKTEFLFGTTQIQDMDTLRLSSRSAFQSGIRELGGIFNLDYYPNTKHHIKAGFEAKTYQFSPGISGRRLSGENFAEQDTSFGSKVIMGYSSAAFVEDEWNISPRLGANIGFRANLYHSDNTNFVSLEPRFSLRFMLGAHSALKLSGAKMSQFVHQLSNSDAGIPTDLWVPATARAPVETSWIAAIGIAQTFRKKWEFSYEFYYRVMDNLIDYKAGQTFWGSVDDWQDKIEVGGTGEAYGGEFFLHKKTGKTQGWLSYTLAWSNRTFTHLNQGRPFPYKYDNRHNSNLFVSHNFSKKFQISGLFVFKSGNAVNLATAKHNLPFTYDETLNGWKFGEYRNVNIFPGDRNSFRISPYHRLDLSLNFIKEKKWGKRTWNISIYNLYGRRNPYFYFFQDKWIDGKKVTQLKQYSLFPIIPSVSYKREF